MNVHAGPERRRCPLASRRRADRLVAGDERIRELEEPFVHAYDPRVTRHVLSTVPCTWQSTKVGAGPAPIETD
jgi:hypothetical protein